MLPNSWDTLDVVRVPVHGAIGVGLVNRYFWLRTNYLASPLYMHIVQRKP